MQLLIHVIYRLMVKLNGLQLRSAKFRKTVYICDLICWKTKVMFFYYYALIKALLQSAVQNDRMRYFHMKYEKKSYWQKAWNVLFLRVLMCNNNLFRVGNRICLDPHHPVFPGHDNIPQKAKQLSTPLPSYKGDVVFFFTLRSVLAYISFHYLCIFAHQKPGVTDGSTGGSPDFKWYGKKVEPIKQIETCSDTSWQINRCDTR